MGDRTFQTHRNFSLLSAAVIATPFFLWLYQYFNADFWYDEVLSLTEFTLAPVVKTLADYSVPNNHIFFNLIQNLFFKALGVAHIEQILDKPFLARLWPLAFAAATLALVRHIGRKFFDDFTALAAIIILATSLPFYNFAAQVRGYSLSMLLSTGLVWCLWSYEMEFKKFHAACIVLFTALFLYTVPSNLYFVASCGVFFSINPALSYFNAKKNQSQNPTGKTKSSLVIVACLSAGTILAALWYLPVFHDLVDNPYVRSEGAFRLNTLTHVMPRVWLNFLSGRWVILILAAAAAFLANKPGNKLFGHAGKIIFCAFMLAAPFVLSFLRGDNPYDRVFVNLMPIFSLLAAILIGVLARLLPPVKYLRVLVVVLVFFLCNLSFAKNISDAQNKVKSDIIASESSQNLMVNFYQHRYAPSRLLSRHAPEIKDSGLPLVAYSQDNVAMPIYLRKFGLEWLPPDQLQPLCREHDALYAISLFPTRFRNAALKRCPGFTVKRLNREPGFHNIFKLTRIGAETTEP
jgi:hypothetical protein